jgi:hypothetical protein
MYSRSRTGRSPREHWRVTDTLDMMQQLGAIPAPENAQVEEA